MIYLDSAATTFQKPLAVNWAVEQAFQTMSSPGRGSYAAAVAAADMVFDCRCALAELYGVEDPGRVVFTMNATHALNLAIKSLVPPGGRAVISGWEHNAVTRPLQALGAKIGTAAGQLFDGEAVLCDFRRSLLASRPHAVICTHVSNVFGFVLPIEEVAELCRQQGIPLIVDASQSAGCLTLHMKRLEAAFIAMPGHKGLYGPQGTGVLLCGREQTKPLLEGGTGSLSIQQEMPDFLPDRLEAGTHNVPGIAGLLAGVNYVRERGVENILMHERELIRIAADGLRSMKGVQIFDGSAQTGVLSFTVKNRDVEELAAAMADKGFALRAGLHCAPLAHASAGTLKTGTLRLSVSDLNSASEIFRFLNVTEEILDGIF